MADVVDNADRYTALGLSGQIEKIRKKLEETGAAGEARYCEDCGEEIPAARRAAVPGCTRCIGCQTCFEEG